MRELHEAISGESDARVASEAVDVLFVAIGTVLRLDPDLAAEAIREVIEKNDAKTWDNPPHQRSRQNSQALTARENQYGGSH